MRGAVEIQRFEAADRERYRVRAELDLAGRHVVGFVGTLESPRDAATVVRAVALLRRHGAPVHLLVVGDGPERAGADALALAEALADAATFTGAVPRGHVPRYLAALDVAVAAYASRDDFRSLRLELLEYLAAARPVVAADVADVRHCVRPWTTGLLYRPGDVRGLARAIAALLRDPVRAGRLGAAAREHVRSFHACVRTARSAREPARTATEAALAI